MHYSTAYTTNGISGFWKVLKRYWKKNTIQIWRSWFIRIVLRRWKKSLPGKGLNFCCWRTGCPDIMVPMPGKLIWSMKLPTMAILCPQHTVWSQTPSQIILPRSKNSQAGTKKKGGAVLSTAPLSYFLYAVCRTLTNGLNRFSAARRRQKQLFPVTYFSLYREINCFFSVS